MVAELSVLGRWRRLRPASLRHNPDGLHMLDHCVPQDVLRKHIGWIVGTVFS